MKAIKYKLIVVILGVISLVSCEKEEEEEKYPIDMVLKQLTFESELISYNSQGKCDNPQIVENRIESFIDMYDYPQKVTIHSESNSSFDWCFENPNCSQNPENQNPNSIFHDVSIQKEDSIYIFHKKIGDETDYDLFEYHATGNLDTKLDFFCYSYEIISNHSFHTEKGYKLLDVDSIVSLLEPGDTLTYRLGRLNYE